MAAASDRVVGRWLVGTSLACVLLSALPAQAALSDLTADEQDRIDHGEIVVHVAPSASAIKHFLVVGQVAASAERTYRVFTDYAHYSEIFHLKETRVVHQEGDIVAVRATLEVPWPVGQRWVTNETHLAPKAYSFDYHRVEGSILEYNGSLRIVPKGPELCQVYYTAKTDPGIPFMPVWLINRIQGSMLPSSIQCVRDYLKRHPADE